MSWGRPEKAAARRLESSALRIGPLARRQAIAAEEANDRFKVQKYLNARGWDVPVCRKKKTMPSLLFSPPPRFELPPPAVGAHSGCRVRGASLFRKRSRCSSTRTASASVSARPPSARNRECRTPRRILAVAGARLGAASVSSQSAASTSVRRRVRTRNPLQLGAAGAPAALLGDRDVWRGSRGEWRLRAAVE